MKKISIVIIILIILSIIGSGIYVFTYKGKTVTIENQKVDSSTDTLQLRDEEKDNLVVSPQVTPTPLPNLAPSTISGQVDVKKKVDEETKIAITNKPDNFEIIPKLVNFGFQKASGRVIDTVIIHSTYDALGSDPYSVSGVIAEYKMYSVSPHYLIDREGSVYRLVADQNIAYHAGVSQMPDGRKNVNDFSLGIEIIEKKSDSPNDAQYASLKKLLTQLKSEYKIKYVLGHKDIAPGRKDDPWGFEVNKL